MSVLFVAILVLKYIYSYLTIPSHLSRNSLYIFQHGKALGQGGKLLSSQKGEVKQETRVMASSNMFATTLLKSNRDIVPDSTMWLQLDLESHKYLVSSYHAQTKLSTN